MGLRSTFRATEAAERRQQREAQKRFRELERLAKEQAKLSAIEQARLEVETYENRLEVLLSVHKEQSETWDWSELAASLPPPSPKKHSYCELRAKQQIAVLTQAGSLSKRAQGQDATVEQARLQDEREYQEALQTYSKERSEWEKMNNLARRILAGDHKAYMEALTECSPLSEISDLGSSICFKVHSADLLECVLKVNGHQAIPSEVKTITSNGKVSIKPMPKARFHELYQDYVCGCVLRVAREVFALLPAETVLVTALVDALDSRTGESIQQPVLSVAMPCAVIKRLEFDRLDPSDAMDNFTHRGDVKMSRKDGAFNTISPLTPSDIINASNESASFQELLAEVRRLHEELKSEIERIRPVTNPTA